MTFGSLIIPADGIYTILFLSFAIILWSLLIILAFRNKNRRLKSRILASTIAILSLLALVLRPQWQSKMSTTEAILITPGSSRVKVNRFLDSLEQKNSLFSMDNNDATSTFGDEMPISDLAYLSRNHPEITRLHVFGFGLPAYEWAEIKNIQINFIPENLPTGIRKIHWPSDIILGQSFQVRGVIQASEESSLMLSGPGGPTDSLSIASSEAVAFELSDVPPDTGRFSYRLIFRNAANEVVVNENLGVWVRDPDPLNILIVESSPQFQTKYLKNWLAESGNAVAIRTTISKDRYRYEFLNQKSMDLNTIDSEVLRRIDMLMIDSKALEYMKSREINAITRSSEIDGLGVFITPHRNFLVNANTEKRWLGLPFKFNEIPEIEYRVVKIKLTGSFDRVSTPISIDPFELEYRQGMKVLYKDNTGRILVAAFRNGKGYVATSLLSNTFQWILEGHPKYYSEVWADLISQIARPQPGGQWRLQEQYPLLAAQPVPLALFTSEKHPVGLVTTNRKESIRLYLQQNIENPRKWTGTYWPKHAGWHKVATLNSTIGAIWFYVNGKNAWKSSQAMAKFEATRRAEFASGNLNENLPQTSVLQRREVSPIWFFLLFLSSCSYLWLERKL